MENILNQMPNFQCHKVVRASKIMDVIPGDRQSENSFFPLCLWVDLLLCEPEGAKVRLSGEFLLLHKPAAGGYLVWYDNGHLSYSPDKPFTEGYRRIEREQKDDGRVTNLQLNNGVKVSVSGDAVIMSSAGSVHVTPQINLEAADFSDALLWLKEDKKIAREGWNGKGQYVQLWTLPEDITFDGAVLRPCFVLKNAQGVAQSGWIPSMGDLLATDWIVVD